MKQVSLLFLVLFLFFSCNQTETLSVIPDQNPQPRVEHFGFNFNDFNVLHDTIQQGDTFGSIIESQNIGDKQVYDIIAKVKDSLMLELLELERHLLYCVQKIDTKNCRLWFINLTEAVIM